MHSLQKEKYTIRIEIIFQKSPNIPIIDTVSVDLRRISLEDLTFVDKLGEGQFGEIHLCKMTTDGAGSHRATTTVAVKSLRKDCDATAKSDFEHEARILTRYCHQHNFGSFGKQLVSEV